MKITLNEAKTLSAAELIRRLSIVKCGDHIRANVGENAEELMEILRERKTEVIAELDRKEAEKEAKKLAEREAEYIPYEVNNTEAPSFYNGFWEYHEAVKAMLNALVPEESGRFNRLGDDYRSAILIAAQDYSDEAMTYSYEPFPINEGWSEEYKAEYNRKIESRTAPGKCMIPRAAAERILSDAAARIFERDAADMVKYLKTEIACCEGFVCADMDAVRAARKRYNDINNEGGEGYIPPYCTQESIDTLKRRLAFWERHI